MEVDLAKIKATVLVWGTVITVAVIVSVPFISFFLQK
jgi:hypothetical protein